MPSGVDKRRQISHFGIIARSNARSRNAPGFFAFWNPNMPEVNSASDDRTANNAVRHQYRVLTDDEKAQMLVLKDLGAAFIAKCQEIGGSRELSLAITNAEQAVMWAVKHVTK